MSEKDIVNVSRKIDDKYYETCIQKTIQERIKSNLGFEFFDGNQPHQKITGIKQKKANHKKILSYGPAPNPTDLLQKKKERTN